MKAFARFVAPNEAQLRFKRDGQYVIYYEYAGKVDDTEVDAPSTPPDGLELQMRDSQGRSLDLRQLPKPLSYDVGGFRAVSLRQVRIDQPGEYTLSAGPSSLSPFAIAVGRGEPPSADSWNQAALLVGAIGAGLGIIGLIVTALLRHRSRSRLAERQTAAVLAAPVAAPLAAPVAAPLVVDAPSAWAAPADAGPATVPPPPPAAVPPAPVVSAHPPAGGSAPPPPPPSVVPPPLAPSTAEVGSTPPPPPPPGAVPPSGFEPVAPPPGPMAEAPPEPLEEAVSGPPPAAPPGWAPPAAGSHTEPGVQEGAPPPPP